MSDGGIFRGQRVEGVDYFDDIMGDNSIPQMFDGDGMKNYEKVSVTDTERGVSISMHCRACPSELKIDIPWPELFLVANVQRTGHLPPGWAYSQANHNPAPQLTCQRCGSPAPIIIPPSWAQNRVNEALRSNLLTQEALLQDPNVRAVQAAYAQQGQQPRGPAQGWPQR